MATATETKGKAKTATVPVVSGKEAVQAVPVRRRRRQRTLRGKAESDKVVLEALERIRAEHGDVFKVGVAEIMENFDKRRKLLPSRAGVYRSIRRMAGLIEGGTKRFTIDKPGERGRFTYDFRGTPESMVATPPSTRRTRTRAVTVPNGHHDGDLAALIEEYTSVSGEVNSLMGELQARINAKRTQKQAIETALAVPA